MKTATDLEALADKLLALPTTQKLTVALVMIQTDKLDVAESVLSAALDDLRARRLLGVARVPLTGKAPAAPAPRGEG